MTKSADAFRTISEVADWLETPAHVLRFWESKFSQVKPVKRAGGRRYYRPTDMKLLGGIKKLLHDDGMTIKGVQKLLREHGVAHVAALSQPLGDAADEASAPAVEGVAVQEAAPATPDAPPQPTEPSEDTSQNDTSTEEDAPLTFSRRATEPQPEPPPEQDETAPGSEDKQDDAAPVLPSFLHRREPAPETKSATSDAAPAPEPEPEKPKPLIVNVPSDPDDTVTAEPGVLGVLSRMPRPLSKDAAAKLEPLVAKLRAATSPVAKD